MKTVPLTQGYVALVDDADYPAVSAHKWHAHKNRRCVYVRRTIRNANGSRVTQLLHLFLLSGAKAADHIDGDGLNNCRSNLRPATTRQNRQGFQHKRPGSTSKFRGVHWRSRSAKWVAKITDSGKTIFLGCFSDEKSAARAYDTAARLHFKEFATPNFSQI